MTGNELPPAPPYRPLPKIVARHPKQKHDPLLVGDRISIKIHDRHSAPFWRLYEVTVIDGGDCRLVTPNKRFAVNMKTELVKNIRDLQRKLHS